jgi:hypothetical protein
MRIAVMKIRTNVRAGDAATGHASGKRQHGPIT